MYRTVIVECAHGTFAFKPCASHFYNNKNRTAKQKKKRADYRVSIPSVVGGTGAVAGAGKGLRYGAGWASCMRKARRGVGWPSGAGHLRA